MIDTNLKKMPSFNKKLLDELKRKHNVTMDQIIKQIKPKKEFSNWKVKISRLINKKDTDPSHFGFLKLSFAILASIRLLVVAVGSNILAVPNAPAPPLLPLPFPELLNNIAQATLSLVDAFQLTNVLLLRLTVILDFVPLIWNRLM